MRGELTKHPAMHRSKIRHQFDNPNYIQFSPGNGGAITVRLRNEFNSINLGPGNGGATSSLV